MSIVPSTRPLVSVCCITYNHASFLGQAIESVLMQQTDFAVEMVIGEDCSLDDTRAIAQGFAGRYPGRLRVLTPMQNLGIMPNLMATLAACTGEFIAFLEGDDYWTDASKLQRQVDALRANPECAMCFHDAEIFYDATPAQPIAVFSQHRAAHALPAPSETGAWLRFTQLDLARTGWIMPSASMLFRASSLPIPLPVWFVGVYGGDLTLQMLSTRHGAALYLPRIMACYRMHGQSITATSNNSIWQLDRKMHEAKIFKKHIFMEQNKSRGDIYIAYQYLGYAYYYYNRKNRVNYILNMIKHCIYMSKYMPCFIKNKILGFFR